MTVLASPDAAGTRVTLHEDADTHKMMSHVNFARVSVQEEM